MPVYLVLLGPPGSGKTMLAKRLPTILPDMNFEESLETTKIHSVMGLIPPDSALIVTRPFRSPHHTISDAGLIDAYIIRNSLGNLDGLTFCILGDLKYSRAARSLLLLLDKFKAKVYLVSPPALEMEPSLMMSSCN
jgi:tRNA uridine 5-carbamoylmethylation protein Kti12